jgi:hypothetical protein
MVMVLPQRPRGDDGIGDAPEGMLAASVPVLRGGGVNVQVSLLRQSRLGKHHGGCQQQ